MSIADPLSALKMELQQNVVPQLLQLLTAARTEAQPVHEVERGLWDLALRMGRQALTAFFDAHSTGDLGESLTLPEGQEVQRLEALHSRRYVSIFGEFTLQRTVYGSREGQALAFVPLDNRLQLPENVFSYVLQDWDQSLAMEQAFGQVSQTIQRMLKLRQSVDTLEGMNRQMAVDVGWFRELQVTPPPAEEGPIVVTTADCKGNVIRGQGSPAVCGGQRPAGQRANQKRMAAVGAVYTVAPYVRSPAEWVEALWLACEQYLPDANAVDILDLLHVTPRVWEAAKLLLGARSADVVPFVRQRLTQILEGKVVTVIRGLRRQAAERGLRGARKKSLTRICKYLSKNRSRMRYDEYLHQGYPIASGVIEGACRHLIKDRMERAGMHWTPEGAQAMLDLRSIHIGGHWEAYQSYRIEREIQRLYPQRELVAGEAFFALAA